MNLDELIPAPSSKKVTALAKRVFGYSLDLDNITESKAQRLHKNLQAQMAVYENRQGQKAVDSKKYYEMKLALEALTKHMAERDVDEADVDEDNAFNTAAAQAKKAGKSHFSFNGKKYKVKMDASTADALTDDEEAVEGMGMGSGRRRIRNTNSTPKMSRGRGRGRMGPNPNAPQKPMTTMPAGSIPMGESVITEGEMENAELVLAAKSMVDKYDAMIQDVGEMLNEQLQPLTDKIRDEMGSSTADSFMSAMSSALGNTMEMMKTDRASADQAARILTGDTPADSMGAEPEATDDFSMEPTVDQDEFAASDAAMGGEEPVGREKRD